MTVFVPFRFVLLPFSVSFYYRSPFRFFCRLCLNGTVLPPFLVTCNTYVLATCSYIHRRNSDKTYASCWIARAAVGSLVLHEAGGYIPPPPGPQTRRYIAKIAAGGNQGNRTRNRQVLSEIYRVGVGRKEAREWKTVETKRNGMDRFTPFLGKRCRHATQTKQTVFRKNNWTRTVSYHRTAVYSGCDTPSRLELKGFSSLPSKLSRGRGRRVAETTEE